ncbi:M20 family metallopeptidase [Saccharopolyspora sp. NPDC002686]|uniref:M20 metallopeptidase family protein n=1 Tax=Saccharopolyspora sp. NPDC002686 TaxID=3154541 RepID=UPI003325FCC1
MSTSTSSAAESLQVDLLELRRALHAEPEVGLQLPRTQRRVLDALAGLPLEITSGERLSSVTAVLRGGRPGPPVLLRGDMDALPMTERTGSAHASRIDGAMHSCGHDLHTAMLVGAAHLLSSRREELAGDVIFMFQPGEEGCDGAGKMIDEGVLEAAGQRPVAAYALHVLSSRLPNGVFASRRGPMLAGGDVLKVGVRGKGGHGSAPHLARNPIPAACAMVGGLQALVADAVDPFDPAVLTIGAIHSGTAGNIIPEQAVIEGSLRYFSPEARDALRDRFRQVCLSTALAHGVEADPEVIEYVAATVNDDAEADFAAEVVGDLHGTNRFHALEHPLTAGEDFSRVLEQIPGAFLMLGACPTGVDPAKAPENHSPYAVFDDGCLSDGAALLAELAVRRLARTAA